MIRQSHIERRSHLALHCNQLQLTSKAIEVGVYRGDFSNEFRSLWQGHYLDLIDPWCDPICDGELKGNNKDLEFVTDRFKDDKTVQIIRDYSETASFRYPHNSVDFIYLDADHTYEAVYNDMVLWWPKLRHGGILAGHDFFAVAYPGLTEAVIDFGRRNDKIIHCIMGDVINGIHTNAPSWYMYK